MRLTLSILSILIVFVSCKKDKDNSINYGYHYFPMEEGHYVIYDVMDVFHDSALIPAHDTSYYQIKEVIGEEFTDELGETARKLRRYKRLNDTLDWEIKDVWSIKRTDRNAEIVEENKRRVAMAFAISYDQEWDYNAKNIDNERISVYEDIYRPISIGGIDYDSSVIVNHVDFTTFIEYIRSYDVFAPNIGRVYSLRKDLDINNFDTLDVFKGTESEYIATSWGME